MKPGTGIDARGSGSRAEPRCGRRRGWRFVAAALAIAISSAAHAEVVKLATLAPQGSIWDLALREMADRWKTDTAGRVELRIYSGGVAGDESDMVRKMRIGQFQGAALTVTGLGQIEPAFHFFQLPMVVENYDELGRVVAALRPELEKRLAEKGFVLVFWMNGGWVHLFSREPLHTVDDVKKTKIFAWAGNTSQIEEWRKGGFQPVPLAATDILMGFETKMIDGVGTTPLAALQLQWFRQAPYMQALPIAPLIGALVVAKPAWEKLSETDRAAMKKAALDAEMRLMRDVPKQDDESVEQMKQRGLTVVAISAADAAGYRRAAENFLRDANGGSVPSEILATAQKALAEARAAKGESH